MCVAAAAPSVALASSKNIVATRRPLPSAAHTRRVRAASRAVETSAKVKEDRLQELREQGLQNKEFDEGEVRKARSFSLCTIRASHTVLPRGCDRLTC